MNTFNDRDESQNLVSKMPRSKREAHWVVEDIKSTTQLNKMELLVLNNERGYCDDCFYIIGVVTHDKKTEYSIDIEVLDANFNNTKLMKIGETYTGAIKADEFRVFRFIVDDLSTITITQQNDVGHVET